MSAKATRRSRGPHGRTAPLPAVRRSDFLDRPAAGTRSAATDPSDDARRAPQDSPHAFATRRRPALRLAPDRVQRARLARPRRPRGGDEPEPDVGAPRAPGALPVLGPRPRPRAVDPRHAPGPAARRRGRVL